MDARVDEPMTERNRVSRQLGICDFVSPNNAGNYFVIRLHPLCWPVGIFGVDLILPLACEPPTARNLDRLPLTANDVDGCDQPGLPSANQDASRREIHLGFWP